ncbi:MAG: hypothetical protein JO319_02310, partial [Acidobacteriaceae bacterium]|nr:hypothetical protein [Acidobacteriaceae bacterium]
LRAYGKPTIEVLTRTIDSIQGTDESHVDAIVFLNRPAYQSGSPLILPVSYEDAWKRLCFSVWAVQMPAFEERLAALERLLLTVPTFEIQYSELGPAVDLLERAVQDKLF